MPPSQLKRLKVSLRNEGIVGPQQSKKQKKRAATNGVATEKRAQRSVALQAIREQFNPFEVQAPSRGRDKFEVLNNRTLGGRVTKGIKGRPGVTKGYGEETRRKTLLTEMQRRRKVGGILDRRFGENDPTMTPEDRMLERFTKEKQRGFKRGAMFDLEDDADEVQLTHFGQSLSYDGPPVDDFDAAEVGLSNDDDAAADQSHPNRKRPYSPTLDLDSPLRDAEDESERKKSKAEVMKEVIAKSKYHRYERQQAKDEDEDEREELDKELPALLALMNGRRRWSSPIATAAASSLGMSSMNSERAALMGLQETSQANKEYDLRLRQMALDKRSQPTERTKTVEEKAVEEASRLKELEERRLRRMRGEEESSDEDGEESALAPTAEKDEDLDDAGLFGLGVGAPRHSADLEVEDEDDFVIDQDLIASDSDIDESEGSLGSESVGQSHNGYSDEDEEFVGGLLGPNETTRPEFSNVESGQQAARGSNASLAYTYPCPENHKELLQITSESSYEDLPIIVQRIRALYHPKLHGDNKAKLGLFAGALVDHISYLANQSTHPPFSALEALLRHIHSLAKSHPEDVGSAFRRHLQTLQQARPLAPNAGDLMVFTAVSTIFPTSDHFHSVVTPTILSMARYLGQKVPSSVSDLVVGTYIGTLSLQYQKISKRYIPELVNYTANALWLLAPLKSNPAMTGYPYREGSNVFRVTGASSTAIRHLHFGDTRPRERSEEEELALKNSLLETQLAFLDSMAELWASKSAFYEVFKPALTLVQHLGSKACSVKLAGSTKDTISRLVEKLQRLLAHALISRRPLELHHHRPLAIKTSVPKFEESYNLDKHYDPDRERSEMSKLRAEHKRERKGALRELRKDANFIARESLREKKERDGEYEKKYKRLVAEIQGEEGREANLYEREKRMRKGRK